MERRISRMAWGLVGAVALGLAAPDSARAFYWPGWPGADGGPSARPELPPTQVQTPPTSGPPTVVAAPPPGETPGETPPVVPEPSAILSALLGVGLTVSYRRWKSRREGSV